MSERELAARFFGGWIVGAVAITVAMIWHERRKQRDRRELDNRVIVQDEVLRNIVKQTKAMQDMTHDLRCIAKAAMAIAEVIMCLDTIVSKEERQ